ncbi:hypothetical protein [Pseudomonas juntendi]|uniref:hypothetical protein n=1 Tax=Pseudomonas juntendi TaxID=2666183 RepID=UPI002949ADE7|nr:hypothetical protein [Pseudomonas juntendi]MDV5387581.1 hypothetical protein [Pseudomonas juntendi]
MTKHKYFECDFDIPLEESYDEYLRAIRDLPPKVAEKVKKDHENFAAWLSADIDARILESILGERDQKADYRKS